jgi:hypothetical protein
VTESLSIPVYQPQRLEIMNTSFFEDGMGMATLSFQFVNKGRSPLYNMNIRVEGPMNAMEGDYYIGTFNAGQSDYYEDSIIPQMYGELEGFIVIEYEDSAGTAQEFRSPLSAFISEPFMPGPGGEINPGDIGWPMDGMDGIEGEGGGGWFQGWRLWAIIGGAAVVCAVVLIVVIRRVKRKRAEAELADYEQA